MKSPNLQIDHLAYHKEALPEIVRWVHTEWGHLMSDISYKKLISIFQERLRPYTIPETFVAIMDNKIVGTASIVAHDLSTRMDLSPWMAAVYVMPEYRKLGIGSTIVQAIIDEATLMGLERIYLITPDQESFYAKLGWQALEKTHYRGESVIIMAYKVSDQENWFD
jgi:N-acetylglutamate synthase-like GNAT family acetyltransferase